MKNNDYLIGQLIGNYQVLAPVASGAFGTVYQARHQYLAERIVAIKILHWHRIVPEEARRFLQEAHILEKLSHPYVLNLLDAGFHENQLPYLITAYASGGSLRQYLRQPELTKQKPSSSLPISPFKLAPPPTIKKLSCLLQRQSLLSQLDNSLKYKMTLVTAPAGFGKTTLLSMWFKQRKRLHPHEAAWATLDESDNDPTRFWSTIWGAFLSSQASNYDREIRLAPYLPMEAILHGLLNINHQCVIILDDYHTINNSKIQEEMELLLNQIPANIHILLSSRQEPPLALGRARLYGEIFELHAEDLRLQPAEIAFFLEHVIGMSLSQEEQTLLEQRTEGWIAGLHLAVLALQQQKQPGEMLSRFTGSQSSLFDYFAEEVYASQPPEIQLFLLHTSPLKMMTPSLCAAIFNDPKQDHAKMVKMLKMIARANVFVVPLNEQLHCYRYHALFHEFLREKLQRSLPTQLSTIQQRAAIWYEENNRQEEAIDFALAAQDYERAIRLIEQLGEDILWQRGEIKVMLTWLQKIPTIFQSSHPRLAAIQAWTLILSGQQSMDEVDVVIQALETKHEQSLKGEVAALHSKMASFRDDIPQVIDYAQQALKELPEGCALLRADVAFSLGGAYLARKEFDNAYQMLAETLYISQELGNMRTVMFASRYLAITCMDQGKMTEAEGILRQALQFKESEIDNHIFVTGIIHITLAELLYERNELTEAYRHANLGIELGEVNGEIKVLLLGYCILAQILKARGEFERSWQKLQKAERVASIGRIPWLHEQIALISMQISLLEGDPGKARRSLQKNYPLTKTEERKTVSPLDREFENRMNAILWLHEGRYTEMLTLLEPISIAARKRKDVRVYISVQILQALALDKLNKGHEAKKLLSEALKLAGPENFTRIFLDLGTPLLDLLERSELRGNARTYARKLLETQRSTQAEGQYHGGLSSREQEVLQLVAMGLSNQEIAAELVVAASTIKVHVRHLYQKLGVQKRIQAVTKARELGLL